MTLNQIKHDEILLKDRSKTPWIVIYYQKNTALEGTVNYDTNEDLPHKLLEVDYISEWEFYNETNGPIENGTYNIDARTNIASGIATSFRANINSGAVSTKKGNFSSTLLTVGTGAAEFLSDEFVEYGLSNLKLNLDTEFSSNNISSETLTRLLSFNVGDILKTTTGQYWEITAINVTTGTNSKNITAGSLYNDLAAICNNSGLFTGSPNEHTFSTDIEFRKFKFTLTQRNDLQIQYSIPATDKLVTEDCPYDICVIPYNDFYLSYFPGSSSGSLSAKYSRRDVALATASAIIKNHGSLIFDVQLLPYFPIQSLISTRNDIITADSTKQFTYIINSADNSVLSYIFHVPNSQFTFNIEEKVIVDETSMDKKVKNQCYKYRLCSPNFDGYFDFSAAKNNGVDYFNVDCVYKPYSPYIHINPNFKNLYGKDFNDPRGLICGGDFSLTQIEDKWQEYQLQNKNYQEIFNRDIQNLELTNEINREKTIFAGAISTIGGAIGGITQGAKKGAYGAIAGGLVGTIGAGLGAGLNLQWGDTLRSEALDYKQDMFGYQLGNIQALPDTLKKVTSLNNNNKIFPILEIYKCTEEEETAFINKIAYNGMTVMRIGKISDFLENNWTYKDISSKNYIKGKIIRLSDLIDDFHIANEIANEINKGAYYENTTI